MSIFKYPATATLMKERCLSETGIQPLDFSHGDSESVFCTMRNTWLFSFVDRIIFLTKRLLNFLRVNTSQRKGHSMDYMKPEIIDLTVEAAGGAPCNNGSTNYGTGCTTGVANQTSCNNGPGYGSGPGCSAFGYGAQKNCSFGFGVTS